MKNTFYILIALVLLMVACGRPSGNAPLSAELQRAEDLMYPHPDSALHILQAMTSPKDELNHATWALFTTQAKYKLFMTQSDSLLNIAFPYFMEKGDAQRRAMVLYYRAALYHEENKMEEAQEYYLKAIDEIEKTEDYLLAYLIYKGLGDIYSYKLPDYAIEYYTQAQNYAFIGNNHIQIIASYISVARIYGKKKNYDNAIYNYEKAIELAEIHHEHLKQLAAMSELAIIYKNKEEYQRALSYLHNVLKLEHQTSQALGEQKYLTIAQIYRRINQPDSAIFYLQKVVDSSNPLTRRGVYTALFYALKEKGLYKQAADYLEKGWILKDSISKDEKSQALIEMQEKYDQQQVINEKNELEIKKNQTILKVLVCLVAAIITIAILIFFYQKKLLAKERQIKVAEQAVNKKAIQIAENENTISRNEARILALSEEIGKNKGQQETLQEQREALEKIKKHNHQLEQKNIVLKQDISTIQQNLEQKSKEVKRLQSLSEENLYLRQREQFLSELLVQKNKLLNNLIAKPQYIEIEEWASIIREVDNLFDGYTQRLSKLIPSLTESDIQICCLIKLHISNPTIAILLAISSSSVTKRKVRLKERILQAVGTLGDSQSLEIWLWEF